MSNAKRKTLLIIQAAIVALFVLAILLGMGATSVQADDVQIDSVAEPDAATQVKNLFVNGNVSEDYDAREKYANQNSTPLDSQSDIQSFLKGEKKVEKWENNAWVEYDTLATIGYLTQNVMFSWDLTFTSQPMKDGLTFDGNGKEISLTANTWNTKTSSKTFSELGNIGANTFFKANDASDKLDINGAFIGFVPATSKIINTKFLYNYAVSGRNEDEGAQGTPNSGTGGLIAGYCRGVIDNCKITLSGNSNIQITKWSINTNSASIARHSYAFGGMVGVLAGNVGVVSNCAVDMQEGSLIKVHCDPSKAASGITGNKKGNGRVYLGGLIGWMGAGSNAFNLTVNGSGTLESTFGGNINNALGQVGGAVGSCTVSQDASGTSSISGTSTIGHINGIINQWTGFAKYQFEGGGEGQYAPSGSTGAGSTRSMLVGMSGDQTNSTESVSNIYCVGNMYESGNNNYSIGFSYDGNTKKKVANVVDMKYRKDDDNSLSQASSDKAYLIWGGIESDSKVWAVYDISADQEHILWSTLVNKYDANGTLGEHLEESYYWRNETVADSDKYDVTYTPLIRGNFPLVNIEYEFGRAVYIRKYFVNADGHTYSAEITGTETVEDIQYGSELQVPEVRLFTHPNVTDRNQAAKIISHNDRTYWKTLKGSAKNPNPAAGVKEVGEYTTFLYLDNPATGLNYANIHLLDTDSRLVAYVQDDPNYKKFAEDYEKLTGNKYSHVDESGAKNFDWQPRIKQTVIQRSVTLDIKEPNIPFQNLPNGARSAEYEGKAIIYSAAVKQSDLVSGDTSVTATIEYYNADDDFNKLTKVSGATDVGNYLVHPVSLSNPNYRIDESVEDKKLNIRKRNTILQLNEDFDIVEGQTQHTINLTYNALEQIIKFGSGVNPLSAEKLKENGWAFYFYNVVGDDVAMIQIEIMSMTGEGDYDAINVPEEGAGGSYKVVISFADGDASENYNLPSVTTFVVNIVPADLDFERPTQTDFIYGGKTPESDGFYAYGIAKDGVTKIEPTSAEYWHWENDTWVSCGNNPKNVGRYKIVYHIKSESERNYNDSDSPEYIVNIEQRSVTFKVTEEQETELRFGSVHKPGSGAFGLFNSTTNTGLSTEHGYYHGVTYRYQRIGEPFDGIEGDMPPYTEYTDMNKIVEDLPDHVWDVGCYIVYPVLTLPCSDPSHNHEGEKPQIWDAEQAANYDFHMETTYVNVWPLDVTISLKDARKEYSKSVTPFVGEANADEEDRAWSYVGTNTFKVRDNIVVNLTTEANESSEVGGKYAITVSSITGKSAPDSDVPAGDPEFDKAKNYNIRVVNENETSYLYVDPLTINIRTYVDKGTAVYGDMPPQPTYQVEGENNFMPGDVMDNRWVYYLGDTQIDGEPKDAGMYEVGIDFSRNEKAKNYKIVVNGAAFFEITPREIKIDTFEVENASRPYNGQVQYPNAKVTFKNMIEEDKDKVTVAYNFFNSAGEIVNNPINVGTYTARVDENRIMNLDDEGNPTTLNNNYRLVKNEGNVEFMSATVEITPVEVHVNVNNAVRVYRIPGSLKAVKNDIEGNWWEHPVYIGEGELPYTFGAGKFMSTDKIEYELYIDEYFEELKVHTGVVKIRFAGEAIDAENYIITYTEGDLLVKDADFNELEEFLFVTYDGERYVDVEDSVVYTGENLYGKFDLYTSTDAVKNALSISIATDSEGKNITTSVVNAGTYYMVIRPSGADSPFKGEKILPFTVQQAVRNITADDIIMRVHYNKLVFSSDIPGLQYSINGEAFLSAEADNTYEYLNVSPLSNYHIRVKVEEGIDPNYKDSNVLDIYARTGFNAGDLARRLNAISTITFSNISTYRALKAQLNDVHEDDMYLIDANKIAALDASYAKLLSDASAVISGAQDVAAKTVGKSNTSARTAAMALSGTGLGIGAVGLAMGFIVRKKKEDKETETMTKKKNARRHISVLTLIIAIVLVAATVLAGCSDTGMTQDELFDLASYKVASNEKSRDYEITVSHGSTIVYRNENGVETSDVNVTAPSFSLGENGSGLDFNSDYFENISFVTSRTTASFTADIKNVASFLGRANATDAKVSVVANIENKRLESIEISYNEGEFKTKIKTTLNY